MDIPGPNILQEKDTVEKMIRFYCSGVHKLSKTAMCDECESLLAYAHKRLDYCQFGEDKPTCRKCPVHCYNPAKREMIRKVMRYSGPRIALRAPVEWVKHWIHERRSNDN